MSGEIPILASAGLSGFGVALNVALILLLVGLSAAFSGSEPALFSLTRTQLQHNAASPNRLHRLTAALMEQPKRTLTVILLGNTAVNVLLYANLYVFFDRLRPVLGAWAGVLSALVGILVVSIAGEAVPKTLGVTLTDRLAPFAAALVHVSGYVFGPLGRMLHAVLIQPLDRLLLGPERSAVQGPSELTTSELGTLLDMSRRQGVINPAEDLFLREVIGLGDLRVRDVMVPRVEVIAYDVDASPDGLRELIRTTRRKRIPVYEGSVDNIVGLIYAKILFLQPECTLRQIVMPVRFVKRQGDKYVTVVAQWKTD